MTPGTSAKLGNRSRDSHICSPTATDLSLRFLPGLLANHEMAKRSIPALPKTCIRKMPSKAALLKRTRAQRIPFRPGVRYSNKGRIHSRRPILSSSFFACKTAADHTFRIAHIYVSQSQEKSTGFLGALRRARDGSDQNLPLRNSASRPMVPALSRTTHPFAV